jgi:hypothetical protein
MASNKKLKYMIVKTVFLLIGAVIASKFRTNTNTMNNQSYWYNVLLYRLVVFPWSYAPMPRSNGSMFPVLVPLFLAAHYNVRGRCGGGGGGGGGGSLSAVCYGYVYDYPFLLLV